MAALEEEMGAIVVRMQAMAAARAQLRAAQRDRRGAEALQALREGGDTAESGYPPESGDAPRVKVSVTVVVESPSPIAQ